MKKTINKNKKGFTLIEIIIVIAIIAVLVGFLMNFKSIISGARATSSNYEAKQIENSVNMYEQKMKIIGMGLYKGSLEACESTKFQSELKSAKCTTSSICKAMFCSVSNPNCTTADTSTFITNFYGGPFYNTYMILFAGLNSSQTELLPQDATGNCVPTRADTPANASTINRVKNFYSTYQVTPSDRSGLLAYAPNFKDSSNGWLITNTETGAGALNTIFGAPIGNFYKIPGIKTFNIGISIFSKNVDKPFLDGYSAYLIDKKYDDGLPNKGFIRSGRIMQDSISDSANSCLKSSTTIGSSGNCTSAIFTSGPRYLASTSYACFNAKNTSGGSDSAAYGSISDAIKIYKGASGYTGLEDEGEYTAASDILINPGSAPTPNTFKSQAKNSATYGCNMLYITPITTEQ